VIDAQRRPLTGWGRAQRSVANVVKLEKLSDVDPLLSDIVDSNGTILARGLGRSYGDAAQLSGGTVLELGSCNHIHGLDEDRLVSMEAGVSIDALLRWSIGRGLFVPVTPGTAHVTIGGAVASDVHGKNHHQDGSIGNYIRELTLLTPTGQRHVGPKDEPELFWATIGGMGLTGIVTDVKMEMLPIETAAVRVDTDRTRDLDECMQMMSEEDHRYRYSVAWVDCLARGASLGRSVLTRGNHATSEELSTSFDDVNPLHYAPRRSYDIPMAPPLRLANAFSVSLFNEAWYRKSPAHRRDELQSFQDFFYPLDRIGAWNLLYGRRGFVQYQFVVPYESGEVVKQVIESLAGSRLPSLLAVLKRFGAGDEGPISFPVPGWTLALDIPLSGPKLGGVLDEFDRWVAEAGGRVYLSKDARLRPDLLRTMYPRLEEWHGVLHRVDPKGVMQSDLGRRLSLSQARLP
jgi:decaprenylphospho-beta-D-ribofuranose 2-oxidase